MSENDQDVLPNEDELDPFENSIAEKMQIARNVVIHCERMSKYGVQHIDEMRRNNSIMNYTGVCEDTIIMADTSLRPAKTFKDWFIGKVNTEANEYCFSLGSIRKMILELYTTKVQVATLEKLVNGLFKRRCMRERYDNTRLKNDIIRHGFTWKRIPGTRKSILVERNDQFLKKMEYLTRMKAYRQAGRSIVYVDAFFYYYQLVVSPQHGLLHMGFHSQTENEKNIETWTKNTLIPVLPPNSVVVLKHDPLTEKATPTPITSKSDMISWLSERNIPHDPNVHRADLYALIKKFRQPSDTDNYVYNLLRSLGHDVVYRPPGLKDMDYLELMWPGVPAIRCRTDTIVKLRERTLEYWQKIEDILKNREEAMYQEDIMMEAIADKILTFAKYGQLTPADLEECDNMLVGDEYYSSIIID